MKQLIKKLINKETITYIIFGVLTTVINYVSYYALRMAGVPYVVTNIISWIVAVLFAFITNKIFVFESHSFKAKIIISEFITFIGARLLSLLFETGFLMLTVEVFHMNDLIAKIISSVFVIIFNYFASKFFIFKNKKSSNKGEAIDGRN